jgi:sirohydrochlorin cobaltochelatase
LTRRVDLDPSRITAVSLTDDDRQAFEAAQERLRALLPEDYQETYDQIQPVSMGSAGLKYGADGQVAWSEMWATFCDLAMAGGPPHKGALLEPAPRAVVEAAPERHQDVVDEICRGITLASELPAQPSTIPGWVSVDCYSETMASWLLRAIVMENVMARSHGRELRLPASPDFRLEKEIKNVVTVIAKTTHYWMAHMSRAQKGAIAELFAKMSAASPLIEPADAGELERGSLGEGGWKSIDCQSVKSAVWMMRGIVVHNVLARREEKTLLVANNPATDPNGVIAARTVMLIHRLAALRGVS